ncbi:unnamed protein product [Blepharisma stoltei]|uniref:Centrosomal protein of 162 kDa n=1 Tax=Blepharisma stoltei TaxID=1481888 RepID=A0AAU9K5F5_9CILI|nr:unnamed protein product [Blepharisma stoltei]
METSIRDDLERFYHEHESYLSKESHTPKFENKRLKQSLSPKEVEFKNQIPNPESENLSLKQRLKELEFKYAEALQTTTMLEKDLKRAIIENEKLKREKAYLGNLLEKLDDKRNASAQPNDYHDEFKTYKDKANQHIANLIEKCERLQEEVLLYQSRDQQSQTYKRKFETLEEALNKVTLEKDKRIAVLEHKIKKLRHQRHIEHHHMNSKGDISVISHRHRSKTPVPPSRSASPLLNSQNGRSFTPGIDDLNTKIISLEQSQTEYRRKLRTFLQDSSIPKDEIEKLTKILQQNDDKLYETKKVQKQMLRSSMRAL